MSLNPLYERFGIQYQVPPNELRSTPGVCMTSEISIGAGYLGIRILNQFVDNYSSRMNNIDSEHQFSCRNNLLVYPQFLSSTSPFIPITIVTQNSMSINSPLVNSTSYIFMSSPCMSYKFTPQISTWHHFLSFSVTMTADIFVLIRTVSFLLGSGIGQNKIFLISEHLNNCSHLEQANHLT